MAERSPKSDTGSEESFDFVCGPCSMDGSNLQAAGYCADCGEYLCVSCYKYHLRPLPCRHHVLFDKETMPKDKLVATVRDTCTERCPTHFGKLVEHFCPIHEYLGCSACMTVNHRGCEGVTYIPDEAEDIYTGYDYVNFKTKLTDIAESIVDNRRKAEETESEAESIHARAMDDAKTFKSEINTFLDKIENATNARSNELKDQHIANTKLISERCDKLSAQLQSLVAIIETKHSLNQKCNLYVAMKRAKRSVEEYEETLKGIQKENKIRRYMFQPEKKILKILTTAKELGHLDVKDSASGSKANNDDGDEKNDGEAEESEEEEDSDEEISAVKQDHEEVKSLTVKEIEESINNKLCTFPITQKEFMYQHWYHCHTCKMVDSVGVCTVCAKVCHKDHDLTYAMFGPFFCDCGAKQDGSCKALVNHTAQSGKSVARPSTRRLPSPFSLTSPAP